MNNIFFPIAFFPRCATTIPSDEAEALSTLNYLTVPLASIDVPEDSSPNGRDHGGVRPRLSAGDRAARVRFWAREPARPGEAKRHQALQIAVPNDLVAPVLDAGAMGIMVPIIETAAQAQQIASWCRYRRQGVRGVALGMPHDDYGGGDVVQKLRDANERTLVIARIGTATGIADAAN
jgi:hypothetical protein